MCGVFFGFVKLAPQFHEKVCETRSYAALRAADLDWIVGPGYSSGRYILEKNQHGTMNNHENQPGPMKKQKRYERGVTTDQGRGGGAGISKNVTLLTF